MIYQIIYQTEGNNQLNNVFIFLILKERGSNISLCRREDLNLHPLRDTHLKRTRIPIPPRLHWLPKHIVQESGASVNTAVLVLHLSNVYLYDRYTVSITAYEPKKF